MKLFKLVCAFIFISGFAIVVNSAPRLNPSVTKTSRNEGDKRSDIGVSLSSTSWTVVLSQNYRRRDAVLGTLSTANYNICLSSHNTTALSCSSTLKGIRIEPGGTYTDYNEAVLYGRIADAGSGVYLYGQEHYDSADSSTFQ
jgi:hypothetical protein